MADMTSRERLDGFVKQLSPQVFSDLHWAVMRRWFLMNPLQLNDQEKNFVRDSMRPQDQQQSAAPFIYAIKALRERTGCGLREAKDACDEFRNTLRS
jgi:hypothetical protein